MKVSNLYICDWSINAKEGYRHKFYRKASNFLSIIEGGVKG